VVVVEFFSFPFLLLK